MDLHLKDKVVVLTGAASGIAKAASKIYLEEGAVVCMVDLNEKNLTDAVSEFKKISPKVFGYCSNVADEDSVIKTMQQIAADHGQIDILVNNVGIIMDFELVDMPYEKWKRIFNVNIDSYFLCTKEAVKYMKRERKPVILNAASVTADWPTMGNGAYSITKGCVKNFTKVLCGELARKGIRVMGYEPGMTRTPINDDVFKNEPARIAAQIPFRRIAEPNEIAQVIVFLSSDQASYMGGSFAIIDGGKLAVQNPRRYDADAPETPNL